MKKDYFRVPITMPPDMFEGLEALSIKSKITGGHKLANTEMVRAAIRVMLNSGIDVSACKDEEELEKRLLAAMKKPQL